jgi:acetylornithine deacetylase
VSARQAGIEERLLSAVAARRDEIASLAQALVRFDTTARNPQDPARDEAAVQALLADRLGRAGAEVEVFEPPADAIAPWRRQIGADQLSFEGRPQLIARWPGSGGGRSLILNGHIDAVSVEPRSAWSIDPFAGEISGSRLIGRGACDMKGGVAAMVVAAETVASELGPLAG